MLRQAKLGIISTTIHNESGYLPFDFLAKENSFFDVAFYIAGDLKTPAFDTSRFSCRTVYLSPEGQRRYHCSPEIGWNKIMRRNAALLRCIEDQPDYILTIDDDNAPPGDYFKNWQRLLTVSPRRQAVAKSETENHLVWHNYLRTSDAAFEIYPRGYPISEPNYNSTQVIQISEEKIQQEDIWLYQGISLGDPDVDAMTRITINPRIQRVVELDYVLQDIWSPYNTQNTLFAKPLFPLAFVWPHCGRFDDIFASFAWQQFIFSNRKYAHIGNALNFQDRGCRDMHKDLAAEIEGYLSCSDVLTSIRTIRSSDAVTFLEGMIDLPGPEILSRHRSFFEAFRHDLDTVGI